MCGIAGWLGQGEGRVLSAMLQRIRHRGPDGTGMEIGDDWALGNVRLAIIDPENGRLPMVGLDGNGILAYNGEIYGYRSIREKLIRDGVNLVTASDAEILLPLYDRHGPALLNDLNGMFAFALYDRARRRLILARDHYGIKPAVYTFIDNRFCFASEVKAFYAVPGFSPAPDLDAWHTFLNVRFPPAPRTLFNNVWKVPAGCYLTVSRHDVVDDIPKDHHCIERTLVGDWVVRVYRYYRLPDRQVNGRGDPLELRRRLSEAVAGQLTADVDVGVYLSGGLDSSTVAALAGLGSGKPVHTMCLGLNEPTDENDDAAKVAECLGACHHNVYLDENPLAHYREAVYFMEEPKVNCLQGFLLAREARRRRKVMLSGLGGDEVFGGYDVYEIGCRLDRLRNLGLSAPTRLAGEVVGLLLRRLPALKLDLARRGADLLRCLGSVPDAWVVLRNGWDHDRRLRSMVYSRDPLGREARPTRDHFAELFEPDSSFVDGFMRCEFRGKMVDDFLANEDRMSMAHGLEVRVPLLDRSVVEYMLRLPAAEKITAGRRKVALRGAMADVLPSEVFAKRKHGFTFNPVLLFEKDLGAEARSYLTRERIEEAGLFNYAFVERLLHSKPDSTLRWHYFMLWMIMGYHLWEEVFIRGNGTIES